MTHHYINLLLAYVGLTLTAVVGAGTIHYWRSMAGKAADCVRLLTGDLKEARLSNAAIEGAVVNLVQGIAIGKLSGDELRCVREQFPTLAPHIERLVNGNDDAEKERELACTQLAQSLNDSGLRGEDLRTAISALGQKEDA